MKKQQKEKINRLHEILLATFGTPARSEALPHPLDMIIATVLSQSTRDANSLKAFKNLKLAYPNYTDILKADRNELMEVIRPAGVATRKSQSILNILEFTIKNGYDFSKANLDNISNNKLLDTFTKIDGVGHKTASCVLLFALDRNVCPVDTHVHRTLNRIGIVETKQPDETFELIGLNLPDGIAHKFHTNLIKLGRTYCPTTNYKCYNCPVKQICSFTEKSNINYTHTREQEGVFLLDEIGNL